MGNADFSARGSNTRRGVKRLTDTAQNTIKCFLVDHRGDLGWGQRGLKAEEVCGETGNVRSSHGCSVGGTGSPIFPGGSDVHAGSPDIDGSTVIGEPGLLVINIRSGNGDRFFSAGGRPVARVPVKVPGGCEDGDTKVVKLKIESRVSDGAAPFHPPSAYLSNGLVNSDTIVVTQARRNNSGSAGPRCLFGNPNSAGDTVVQWRGSVTTSDKKGEKTYNQEARPSPSSARTFTAMTLEALATPYGPEATIPAQWVP